MKINFDNKIVVVTGGTKGIGLAIAKSFATEGAKVAICSRNNSKEIAADLRGNNFLVYGEDVDVSDKEKLFNFADNVEDEFGGIDIWVSNAGIYPQYKVIDTPEDVWQKVININLKSIYYGGLIAKNKMKKRGGGSLINACSFAHKMPSVGSGVYAASKSGIYSLTRTLAAELAPLNIRVNSYIPGVIETKMTLPVIKEKEDELVQNIALNRIGNVQEVADVVLFLASDKASYITGESIEVSGGKFCVQNPNEAWK